MDALIDVFWDLLPGLIVAIFMAHYSKKQKKRDDQVSKRERERFRSERLRLSLLVASAQLGYATTMALKRGSTNGEVEPAVEQYERAMNEFRDFEREQLAKVATE